MSKSFCTALLASLAATIGVIAPAGAAPTLVDPWHSAGNGSPLGNNYGTVPNMDLLYVGQDAFGAAPVTGTIRVWALYGTLYHVSYADVPVGDIFLRPDAGWSEGVSLFSFALGSYYGTPQTSEVRIYNGDYSSLLFQQVYQLGNSAVTISPGLSSLDGLHIQFSGSPGYVAFDDLLVEAGEIFQSPGAAVPEPATWAMMFAGFAALGAALRRRRAPVARPA